MGGRVRRRRTLKLVNLAFIALLGITALTCAVNFTWLTDIVRRSVRTAALARQLVDGYHRLQLDHIERGLNATALAERQAELARQSEGLAHHISATTRHLTQAMTSVAVASFGTIVAGAGLLALVTRRIARPLKLLLDATERVATGELGHRVGYEAADELGTLAQAFDRMVGCLQRSLDELTRQRRSLDEQIDAATSALRALCLTDDLTGVPNLRYLREAFPKVARAYAAATLVVAGVDHFQDFNAQFGYEAGNLVLVAFARILRSAARQVDMVARSSGAQFLVLMPGVEGMPASFVQRVEASLGSIQKLVHRRTNRDVGIAVGFGQARYPSEGATLDELLAVARRRLARGRQWVQGEFPAVESMAASGKEPA